MSMVNMDVHKRLEWTNTITKNTVSLDLIEIGKMCLEIK